MIELSSLDPTLKLDVRYATKNNFVGRAVYPSAHAFLQKPAAEAIIRIHQRLGKQNLGLLIFDAYRPWHVTKIFWESVQEEHKRFVANPETGSRHNRGCAVDLTLFDRTTGLALDMPTDFDEFSERAALEYDGCTPLQAHNRKTLIDAMATEGFTPYRYEWWHFDYPDWERYPVVDLSFEEILGKVQK
jgi:D-alanyl-D-alanine dipeptidase